MKNYVKRLSVTINVPVDEEMKLWGIETEDEFYFWNQWDGLLSMKDATMGKRENLQDALKAIEGWESYCFSMKHNLEYQFEELEESPR